MSAALEAMQEIDRHGFSPSRAVTVCQLMGGTEVYSHEPLASGKLWKVFDFPDGSKMNVHSKGCAAFEPGERWCYMAPCEKPNKLY